MVGLSACAASFAFAGGLTVEINPKKTFQTIDHFAAADAWSGNFVGKYFPEEQRGQIAKWLFSQKFGADGNPEGIGLSMWRFNIGGGTLEQDGADIEPYQRRAESFLTKDGAGYDWSKCAGQMYFMKKAKEYGCDKFLIFSNTPPVQWTKNGKGYCDKDNYGSNLKPDCYGKFADYMADVAKHFESLGYGIKYISPINEPQVPWDSPRQEGSMWRNSEMAKLARELDKSIEKAGLKNTKILLGESASLQAPVEGAKSWWGKKADCPMEEQPFGQLKQFFDKSSPNYIGDLKYLEKLWAAHTYHSGKRFAEMPKIREDLIAEVSKYGLGFLQTEWCLLPQYGPKNCDGFTEGRFSDNNTDIDAALCMGRLITADFAIAQSQGWGYWKAMEVKGDFALTGVYPKDGRLENGGVARDNKLLWALGNWSFFVRPGYKRVEMSGADDLAKVCSSAFVSPDGRKLVAVFVNSSFDAVPVSFSGELAKKPFDAFKTDSASNLAKTASGASGSFTMTPRSIATLAWDL